jgi:hypothetical protein
VLPAARNAAETVAERHPAFESLKMPIPPRSPNHSRYQPNLAEWLELSHRNGLRGFTKWGVSLVWWLRGDTLPHRKDFS